MKVELSIADDKELRDMIKNMIKGQIVSVAREEINDILKEVYEQKYDLKDFNMKDVVEREIRKQVSDAVYKIFQTSWGDRDLLKEYARSIINKKVNEMFENGRIV
jgi:hypothetical protein